MPLMGEPVEMNTAQDKPSRASQKYSNELKLSANSAMLGAATASTSEPKIPPTTENTRPAPSTVAASPRMVSR